MCWRSDGRAEYELRPLGVDFYSNSLKYSHGFSCVEVIVIRPRVSSFSSSTGSNDSLTSLKLDISVRPRCGPITDDEKSLETHLMKSLRSCLFGSIYPNSFIKIIIQIFDTDGSIASVSFNAAILALLNTGIRLYLTPCAISIGLPHTPKPNQCLKLDKNSPLTKQDLEKTPHKIEEFQRNNVQLSNEQKPSLQGTHNELQIPKVLLDPTDYEINHHCSSVLCLCYNPKTGSLMSVFPEDGNGVYIDPSYIYEIGLQASRALSISIRKNWEERLQKIKQLFSANNFFT